MNFLEFKTDKLSVESVSDLVASPKCGAISVFIGTTRDYFENKTVVNLEYEAYESMALKIMENLCCDIRKQWNGVENIAIYHRLGTVPVKEASVIIAISSPHRSDAIQATEWCIDNLKKSVPIWKKEIYEKDSPEWKENKESLLPIPKKRKLNIQQKVEVPYVAPYLVQIKATNEEISARIDKFMDRKRSEINVNNMTEFCSGDRSSEFSCARVDSKLKKRVDSKGHLQVGRVLNAYYHRDQLNSDYLRKYMPQNGVEERVQNLETQLSLTKCVPKDIYKRLSFLEDRLLKLESISPEYIQFWENIKSLKPVKKRMFSVEDIDGFIKDLESKSEPI